MSTRDLVVEFASRLDQAGISRFLQANGLRPALVIDHEQERELARDVAAMRLGVGETDTVHTFYGIQLVVE